MIFYNNTFRIKIPNSDIYRIHQHLDFYIQEKAGLKIPYSFKIIPGSANDSAILLRTALPLALPGEEIKEIHLKTGDTVSFATTLAVIRHEIVAGKKKQMTPPPERLEEYIHARLARAGFTVQSLVAGQPENIIVRKYSSERMTPVLVPVSAIRATCVISSVAEAEKALVYGIGRKRIFGFGFLKPFRVNDNDESY